MRKYVERIKNGRYVAVAIGENKTKTCYELLFDESECTFSGIKTSYREVSKRKYYLLKAKYWFISLFPKWEDSIIKKSWR